MSSRHLGWVLAAVCFALASPVDAASRKTAVSKEITKAKHHKIKKPAPSRPTDDSGAGAGAAESETLMAELQPQESGESALRGAASYYSYGFHGRRAASGERFDVAAMTAASNRFPLGTWVAVRRLDNDRCVVVRINDRMHTRHRVRIIDLSRGAAEKLRMISAGVAMVRVARLPEKRSEDDGQVCENAFVVARKPQCQDCDAPLVLNLSRFPEPEPVVAMGAESTAPVLPSPIPIISP